MEGCTQKGVAWECPPRSGVRVKGSKVRASWTAHKRRWGWEREVGGPVQRPTDWAQWDINIEPMEGWLTNAFSRRSWAMTHSCVMVRGNWQVTRPSLWMQKAVIRMQQWITSYTCWYSVVIWVYLTQWCKHMRMLIKLWLLLLVSLKLDTKKILK